MRRAMGIILILVFTGACAHSGDARIREDTDEYIVGVQYEDTRGLVKRLGPFRAELAQRPREEWDSLRQSYEQQAVAAFAAYEESKDSGNFPLQDDGIALLQALSVGKGVYYAFEEVEISSDGESATARMVVNQDYSAYQFDSLPLDTRVFLVGEPLGTVQVVTVGIAPAQPLRLLESIVLEWQLTWHAAVDVYPEGWCVDSIRPLAGRTRFRLWEPKL
jgi:hypothetical protein